MNSIHFFLWERIFSERRLTAFVLCEVGSERRQQQQQVYAQFYSTEHNRAEQSVENVSMNLASWGKKRFFLFIFECGDWWIRDWFESQPTIEWKSFDCRLLDGHEFIQFGVCVSSVAVAFAATRVPHQPFSDQYGGAACRHVCVLPHRVLCMDAIQVWNGIDVFEISR